MKPIISLYMDMFEHHFVGNCMVYNLYFKYFSEPFITRKLA